MILDKLVAVLEWEVDARALSEFGRQVKGITDWGAKLARMASFAGAALGALGGVMLKQTATNLRLAQSVGLSADTYLGFEGVLKHVGFEGEKVVDLVEEMTNKIGEMKGLGEMTAVKESVHQLGLEFGTLRDLAPEEQFITILEAAKGLEDEQIAASAVDMLMGGEANRIVGLLRTYDGTVTDIISTHRNLNMITDRGIAGAMAWSMAWDNMTTAASSLFTELAGRAGMVMTPYINRLLDWVAANRELIDQKLDVIVNGIASAMRWLAWAGEKVAAVIEKLGGFANALKLVILSVGSWKAAGLLMSLSKLLPTLLAAAKNTGLFKAALNLLGKTPVVLLIAALVLALEDLWVFLHGGKSLFGELTKGIGDFVDKGLLKWLGITKELTEAEKEAYRERNRLADDVDIQRDFEENVTAAFRQGILEQIDRMEATANEVFDGATSLFDRFTKASTDFFDGVADAGASLWGTIGPAATGAVDTVTGSISSAFDSVIDYLTGDFATGFYESLSGTISNAADSVSSAFGSALDYLTGDFATGVYDSVSGTLGDIVGAVSSAFDSAIEYLTGSFSVGVVNALGQVRDMISSVVDGAIDAVSLVAGSIGDAASTVVSVLSRVPAAVGDLFDAVSQMANSVVDTIVSVFDGISNTTRRMIVGVVNMFGSISGSISGAISGAISAVSSLLDGVASLVSGFVDSTIETVRSIFSTVSGTASGVVSAISDTINSVLDSISEFISSSIESISTTFDSMYAAAAGVVDSILGVFSDGIDWVLGAFGRLAESASSIFSDIANTIIETISSAFNSVIGSLSKIPVIGSMFDGKEINPQVTHLHKALAPVEASVPRIAPLTPSMALAGTTNTISVSSPITINPTTRTDASPQQIGAEVSRQIGEQVRGATQRLSSGVRR